MILANILFYKSLLYRTFQKVLREIRLNKLLKSKKKTLETLKT